MASEAMALTAAFVAVFILVRDVFLTLVLCVGLSAA